jgi:hypothetical protein
LCANRSTLTNRQASPAPISARPIIATGYAVASANTVEPAAIDAIPASSSRRGPNRSAAAPTGTCNVA